MHGSPTAADIITVTPEHLPEFEKKIASFFEEHIHDAVSYKL